MPRKNKENIKSFSEFTIDFELNQIGRFLTFIGSKEPDFRDDRTDFNDVIR